MSAEKFLSRTDAAEYCTARGLTVSPRSLAKWACVGGGPVYRRFGNRAVYAAGDLERWIDERLTQPMASSSALCAEA